MLNLEVAKIMNVGAFSESVHRYLRISGYSQKELADEIGLHPKVLSRKLNGSGNAHLTHLELQHIITTLAGWHAITTQDEVLHLLELAQVEPTILSENEWQTPPLSTLTAKRTRPTNSSLAIHSPQHNLPAQTTPLIGREWAVERLRQQLERKDVRLVTLVGPGGSGKTRLALHIASELADTFAQDVWFVALAGVSDPTQVPISIIQALNITSTPNLSPQQSLIANLKDRRMLLVLDNFEQVREASTILDELLAGIPGLKVLITSRIVLHLYGEHEFSVPPLDVPDPSIKLEPTELLQYGAIQLFVERAQAGAPGFALTSENAATVIQICARVDGLPLALELAAARVKVLPPEQLLERIMKARLLVLTKGARNLPDRQQTLRNAITWSYNLLSSTEQKWFRQLGVFTGGWSLEAAEVMMQEDTAISSSTLDILEQLVDNSLIVWLPSANGQARFTMLETLREYALEQLKARGDFEQLRDWHACYYLKEAETAEVGLRGPQQLVWLDRLMTDRDNFRAALEWSLQQAKGGMKIRACSASTQESHAKSREVAGSRILSVQGSPSSDLLAIELCLRLAASFRPYWEWHGHLTEARAWLGATLEVPIEDGGGETVLAARAKALSEDARLVCLQNDQTRAMELADESLALWQQLDDPSGIATASLHRGWAAHAMGDYETAQRAYQEGLQHLLPTEDIWLHAQLLFYLAAAVGFMADFAQMHALYAQSKELFEQIGDKSAIADLLKDRGGMLLLECKYQEAIDSLLKSITLSYEMGHKQFIATGMGLLSFAFGMREEPDPTAASIHSTILEGAADNLMKAIGLTPWTKNHPFIQMVRQHIRSHLDEQDWTDAYTAGQALTIKEVIDLARQLGQGLNS